MNNLLEIKKRFDVTQYEEEQCFLEEMHLQGWCFLSKTVGLFTSKYLFVACKPEEMVYRIDYNPKAVKNNPDYLRLFWDCGWESCYINNGYVIFRKPKRLMTTPEEIYCNQEERLAQMKRRLKGFLIGIPFWILLSIYWIVIGNAEEDRFLISYSIGLFIAYSALGLYYLYRYLKFKKKIRNE